MNGRKVGTVIPDIVIDYKKCKNPLRCRRCLEVCPSVVLQVFPVKVAKFKETDPEDFRITPLYTPECTGCMECLRACPKNAISVSFPEADTIRA